MRYTDVMDDYRIADKVNRIQLDCVEFITESCGMPVFKALPNSYHDVHRVKVRQQKKTDIVGQVFNEAFASTFHNIRQRAIISQSVPPTTIPKDTNLFYVIPPNGYKYIFSSEVQNSSSQYKQVINTLFEHFEDEEAAANIITDMLKYTYSSTMISEGISAGAEIIIYNVPYYYAVRCSAFPHYDTVVTQLIQGI